MRTDLTVAVRADREANAAVIVFDPSVRGRELRTIVIEGNDGVLGTASFAPDGRLVEIELLAASSQLPHVMDRPER